MPHPFFVKSSKPRVLAHQGLVTAKLADLGVVGNTAAAVEHAATAGLTYIEADCQATKDGAVVLFHDNNLLRVTGDYRKIADITHQELAEIMKPRGGLLTLEDALTSFTDSHFNIDVKSEAAVVPAGQIIADHAERVLLTSFSDGRRIRALRSVGGRAEARVSSTGFLPATSGGSKFIAKLLFALQTRNDRYVKRLLKQVDAIQVPERMGKMRVLTPRLITAAQDAGVEVHVWTINDTQRMRELFDAGVDGIVTDRADEALAIAEKY